MELVERVIPIARRLLTIPAGDDPDDLWLWERARRVLQHSLLIARIPELANQPIDLTALSIAALFHCAAWGEPVQQGRMTRWQVLARPTSDIQRELSAALLQEHAGNVLPPRTARLAADAIRHGQGHRTAPIEAHVLAEAESLDDIGTLYVLKQFRQCLGEGRSLEQLVQNWRRQQEYRYWDLRIADGLRYETTRKLARERLQAVDAFMQGLARDLQAGDLARHLTDSGTALPDPIAT